MPRTLTSTVTAEIRAEMGRQRITASHLASQLGWSNMKLSRILRGEVSPRLEQLDQIAQALAVPAGLFLGNGPV